MPLGTATATVVSTSYPSAANLVVSGFGAGQWAIINTGTISVTVSEDGTNDAFTVPAGTGYTTLQTNSPTQLFVKLASAGSVTVVGNCASRSVLGASGGGA